jgi:predicted transglutaminase-like cysteine proteinase
MSFLRHASLVFAAMAMVGLIAGSPDAVRAFSSSSTARPLFTTGEEKADPPPGWVAFCAEYISECEVKRGNSSAPRTVIFTHAIWKSLYGSPSMNSQAFGFDCDCRIT